MAKLTIDEKQLKSLLLRFFVAGVLIYLTYYVFKPFLLVIISAGILAVVLDPINKYIKKKVVDNSYLASFLSLLIFTLIFLVPTIIIVNIAIDEVSELLTANINVLKPLDDLQKKINELLISLHLLSTGQKINLEGYINLLISSFFKQAGFIVAKVETIIVDILIIYLTTYFFIIKKASILAYLVKISPFEFKQTLTLIKRSKVIINETVKGKLIVIFLQTIAGIIGFLTFKAYAPFLLGFLYGLLSIIPIFGTAIIWVPFVLIKIIEGQFINAVGFLVWAFISNMAVDHYIAPLIIGKGTKLHQIIVLFAILGGIEKFGIIGIVLGPLIAALALLLAEIYLVQKNFKQT